MKRILNSLIYYSVLVLCTGCASFDSDVTELSGSLTGLFFIIIAILSTPRIMAFINFVTNEAKNEEADDIDLLNEGVARREDLISYQVANCFLISAVCIPVIIWFFVMFGMNGGTANVIGFFAGCIASFFIGKNIFLFSNQLRPIAVIVRIVLLVLGVILTV